MGEGKRGKVSILASHVMHMLLFLLLWRVISLKHHKEGGFIWLMVQGALSVMPERHGGGNGFQLWKQKCEVVGYVMLIISKQRAQTRSRSGVSGEGSVGKSLSQF